MVNYLNTEMSVEDFLVKLKMIMPEECKANETIVFLTKFRNVQKLLQKLNFLWMRAVLKIIRVCVLFYEDRSIF